MLHLLKRLGAQLRRQEKGFTLVELLVVVGIIVALAAVIVPNVIQFASEGDTGAQAAEADNIQTAIDSYMADNSINTLPAGDFPAVGVDNSTNNFGAGGILDLATGGYLRNGTTTYFYCWNNTGMITRQDTAAAAC